MTQSQPYIPCALKSVEVPADTPWLPASLRNKPGATDIRFRFSAGERRIYRRKKKSGLPSEWAEKNRVITRGPFEGSKMDFSITPYTRGVLDASFFSSVREITVCSAPQVLKTTVVETALGYVADVEPGPALLVYPDKDTARDNNRDSIQKMIDRSPALAGLKTGHDDDMSSLRIKLLSMVIYMGWAGSATSLSNKSIRYLFLDEKDKYPKTPNKNESGTSDLADKRTNAYRYNKKIWNTSTPTKESGPIWQDLLRAEVIFKYWARCPVCHRFQIMEFGGRESSTGIKWPEDERDPEKIENHDLAWYQCECGAEWDSYQRDQAIKRGQWRAEGDGREMFVYLKTFHPVHIGFHLPSWVSPFISLGKAAAAFLRGTKDKIKLRDFQNSHAAEPWLDYHQETSADQILALRDDRPSGQVPGANQTAVLVFGADTQDNGFYYQILAVGYSMIQTTWVIKYGFVTSFEALARVLWENEYLDSDGVVYPVQFGLIDSQGHRTADVYDFCSHHRGQVLPANGQRIKAQPFTYGNLEYYPGIKKVIPGGLQLVNVNTTYYKDRLDNRLAINPTDPGAWLLPAETDDDYARQMTSECRNEDGVWEQIGSRANHYWDCAVLCQVAADILDVKHWPVPDQAETEEEADYDTAASI